MPLAPGLLLHWLDHGQVAPHSKARELGCKTRGEMVKLTNINIKQDMSIVIDLEETFPKETPITSTLYQAFF